MTHKGTILRGIDGILRCSSPPCGTAIRNEINGADSMRLLFLNDNRAHPNWGAQATPHSIDTIFEAGAPDCERTWLSWDWLRSRHRRLKAPLPPRYYEPAGLRRGRWVLGRLSRSQNFFPRVADDFDRFADEWLAGKGGPMADRFLSELQQSGALVYNGENSLYRNTLEGTRALFLMWLAKTRVGTPTCIINHTAHPTDVRPMMTAMIRKVYPKLDLVTCREAESHRLLHDMGLTNAQLIPDVVFGLGESPESDDHIKSWLSEHGLERHKYVCMSASGLPVSRPRGDWDGEYTALVRSVQKRTGLPVVLVAKDPPCQFLGDVANRAGAVYFGPDHHFTELWPLFRQAAAVVTGHFHYAIIAAIGGCPYVPLSANNHKMAGVCEMLNWEPVEPFDVTDLSSCGEAVTDRLAEVIRTRADSTSALAQRANELRDQVSTLPEMIQRIVEDNR